jgi:hypothetical protein
LRLQLSIWADVSSGSSRDRKTCPRRRQLSPKAGIAARACGRDRAVRGAGEGRRPAWCAARSIPVGPNEARIEVRIGLTVDVEMSGVFGLIHGGLEVDDQAQVGPADRATTPIENPGSCPGRHGAGQSISRISDHTFCVRGISAALTDTSRFRGLAAGRVSLVARICQRDSPLFSLNRSALCSAILGPTISG